jgi:hypothetical protein
MRTLSLKGFAAPLFCLLIACGCGGGGIGGATGSAQTTGTVGVHVTWPSRTRYVPPYANSVVCTLTLTTGTNYTVTINRTGDQASTGDAAFSQAIPGGNQTLTVNAYTSTGGQGSLVATATVTVSVMPGQKTTEDVTGDLTSTIAGLVIDGQPLSVNVSSTLQIAAHAVDASGNTILLPTGALTWSVSSGSAYGSVNATTGLFTATATAGSATVQVQEVGAGKSATATVAVSNPNAPGSLTVDVQWPSRTRYVPTYANSIVCVLTVSASSSYSMTIDRSGDSASTGSSTFSQTFSPGTYTLGVTAYTGADGQGQAVASASVSVAIQAGQTTTQDVSANLASTIDHLVIDGQPLTVVAPNTLQILGHAVDATGATMVLPSGALTWSVTAGTSYGSINSTSGLFTSAAAGAATIELQESGAGKSVTASVTVTAASTSTKFYIADAGNGRIVRMDDFAGTNWTAMSAGSVLISQPAVDSSGRIYWADSVNNQICCASTFGGTVTTYGTTGSGQGQFSGPCAVAVDSQQRIYIADEYNNRLVRMDDMTGTNWTTVGTFGNLDGQLYLPQGVFVTASGNTYVADTGNCRVVEFAGMASSGWSMFGSYRGSGSGQFDTPTTVAVTSTGIYVADSMNNRIVFMTDMAGDGWTTLSAPASGTTDSFNTPSGVAVDANNMIYVTDQFNNRMVRCTDMTGAGWTAFGSSGSSTNQFSGPNGVCIH